MQALSVWAVVYNSCTPCSGGHFSLNVEADCTDHYRGNYLQTQSFNMWEVMRDAPFGQLVRYATNNRFFKYPEEQQGFQCPRTYINSHTTRHSSHASRPQSAPPPDDIEKQEPTGVESGPETSGTDVEETVDPLRDIEKVSSVATNSDSAEGFHPIAPHGSALTRTRTLPYTQERLREEQEIALERKESTPIVATRTEDGTILVDWYTTDDPDNPQVSLSSFMRSWDKILKFPKNWSRKKKAWTAFLIDLYTFVVYCSSSIYVSSELLVMEKFGVQEFKASLGLALYVLGKRWLTSRL